MSMVSDLLLNVRQGLHVLDISDVNSGVAFGNQCRETSGDSIKVNTPITNETVFEFASATPADVDEAVGRAQQAFEHWRKIPGPVRGELVRQIGIALRQKKEDLAFLVTVECGKIYQEALGEVQEMIDVCDFAVGLSRQLYGLTMACERKGHRLTEQWHPLGPIGVISAFNFPVAVWAWNTMVALVCGDPVVWKPSEKTPLTAIACHKIAQSCISQFDDTSPDLLQLVCGGRDVGQAIAGHEGLPLVSATGSIPMGRSVAQTVAARLGRSLLELGGNNAAIVSPSADMELATRAITFSAVGTCGQRCTSLRRIIAHHSIAESLRDRLQSTFSSVPIGDPLDENVLVGPLIDENAFENMQHALALAEQQGGHVYGGKRITNDVPNGGFYVAPALVEINSNAAVVQEETFAPITYLMTYDSFDEAIAIQNGVKQGLSSSIFTENMREAELFCSATGSDCGIANVNIGTSGAEIGGAFGGEKETGGGRESGSDAWKAYMRRATNTINYSNELPLAQGIKFELD